MKNNLPCALTHTDILLLERFCENLDHITKYYELTSIFHDDITLNELSVHISRLRKKIEDNPKKPKNLISVKGVGYILTVPGEQKNKFCRMD